MSSVVTAEDLGEVWKIEVSKAYVGLQLRQEWGAQLFTAGPTGRWRKLGLLVVSDTGPQSAATDLLLALGNGKLRHR